MNLNNTIYNLKLIILTLIILLSKTFIFLFIIIPGCAIVYLVKSFDGVGSDESKSTPAWLRKIVKLVL